MLLREWAQKRGHIESLYIYFLKFKAALSAVKFYFGVF